MKKILFINTVSGFSSTGNLVGELTKINGYESLVCYGRKKDYLKVNSYRFANFFDNAFGALGTILFDNNLDICRIATNRLIKKIKKYNPDIINIHNLHGYYVNIGMLFEFLKEFGKPVVLTLHDAWTMTGYCPHFDGINCNKYQTGCKKCEYPFAYPFSIFKQNVEYDYEDKKYLFNLLDNLTIVAPSIWLADVAELSILKNNKVKTIYNGININDFKVSKPKNDKFTVLAVANIWTKQKGLDDINKLVPLLDKDIQVIVVGENSNQIKGCKAINRTSNKQELIDLYSSSHVLINTTYQETFGLVNVEANACGTPVITYRTGGSPETINEKSGMIVEKGDYEEMAKLINNMKIVYPFNEDEIIDNAKRFDKKYMLQQYKELFDRLS